MLGFPGFATDQTERVQVLKVEAKRMGAYYEVAVFTSENIKPEILLLESPNRIAMSFANSTIKAPLTLAGPSPLIRMVQAAQFDKDTVYVIVEPNEKLSYEYTSIIGRNKFVLEFTKAKPGAKKTVTPSLPATLEVEKPPAAEIIEAPPTPEAVTEIAIKEVKVPAKAVKPEKKIRPAKIPKVPLPLQGRTIVIDPGHGGRDPGYVGKSGIFEKFLNLKIALKLKKLLSDAGAKVILTRTGDASTRDSSIVRLANNKRADLFVAVHLNCYFNPRISGSETYYFTPQSKKFAEIMQKNLCRTIKSRNRGVRKVAYYTIHHTKMPSVLVEAVYLTNPKEEKLILDPKFQAQVAYGMYKGIREYVRISRLQKPLK
ncbi:MAG: N-acetylmuramoyl-L-alanine amidase [bacterium]